MSQNLPKRSLRDFLSLRHPNHFAGANNRNVIITYRFLVAPVQENRDFFSGILTVYRKIPKISPGAYIFQRPFLRGLFLEGLINGGKFAFQNRLGLYLEGNLRLKIDWASL